MSAVVGKKTRPATMANLPERFWRLVDQDGECWIWLGGTGGRNLTYGIFRKTAGEKHTSAHRIAYELAVAPIPDGHHVDHLCREPLCVNPMHLEAVTPEENRRRQSARVTHCKRGHELSGANLYVDKRGFRACRTCRNSRPYSPPKSEAAKEKKRAHHRDYMREWNRRRRECPPS